jgi:hypothetical protein
MALLHNVRDKIEFEYTKTGRLVKHPSGVEVFESKADVEARAVKIDADITALTAEKADIQSKILDKISTAKVGVIL